LLLFSFFLKKTSHILRLASAGDDTKEEGEWFTPLEHNRDETRWRYYI